MFVVLSQAKKKYYDVELENLEKHQKQTIEKMEADHNVKHKEETKRIKAQQERDYHKFLDQLKHKKKEVHLRQCVHEITHLSSCLAFISLSPVKY